MAASDISSGWPSKYNATGAIRIAAPMPAEAWPVSRGETPRSSPASTWRKLRPMPRWAPTYEPLGVAIPRYNSASRSRSIRRHSSNTSLSAIACCVSSE